MELFKTPHIKFMKYKFIALAVTGIIVLAGVLNVTLGKGLKLGVDFGGYGIGSTLTGPVLAATRKGDVPDNARALLEWLVSDQGQSLVDTVGFVPIRTTEK